MRRLFDMAAASVAFLLLTIQAPLLGLSIPAKCGAEEIPPDAIRYVEITLTDDAGGEGLAKSLAELGFQPASDREWEGTGLIRGRLPHQNLAKAAALPGVRMIAAGKPLAADPPELKQYHAFLRFRIDADLQKRYEEYTAMTKRLGEQGFQRTERKPPALEDDWRYSDLLDGKVPTARRHRLIADSRVRTVLLVPDGLALPENPLVELRLDRFAARQREVADLVRERLKKLGFEELVGYDHQGQTRLLGRLPAERAMALHKDPFDVEVPLKEAGNVMRAVGRVLVPVAVYFQGRYSTDEVLKALDPFGFERLEGGREVPGKGGHVRGRLLTRHIEAVARLDGVNAVVRDDAKAVEIVTAIRQAEVLREPPAAMPLAVPPLPKIPADQPQLRKLSPDLLRALPQLLADAPNQPIRVELVYRKRLAADDRGWIEPITEPGIGFILDGTVGPIAFGSVAPAQLAKLAEIGGISTIRLPHAARAPILPPFDAAKPGETGLDFIHLARPAEAAKPLAEFLRKREAHRVAIIDSDFRGWRDFLAKGLPENTRLFDMTAERHQTLEPDPLGGEAGEVGNGTRLALAAAARTPVGELILVRVDPAAAYQVQNAANAVAGLRPGSFALAQRDREIELEKRRLDQLRRELRIERRIVLENFRSDEDARKARAEYRKRQAQFDLDERALAARQRRLVDYLDQLNRLSGVHTVLLGLDWMDGQPRLPGERGGFRHLDSDALRTAVWIQAVEPPAQQSWHGLFRDPNQDEVMEFSAEKPGRARVDLNFLAWQPHPWREPNRQSKLVEQSLPADSVVQITLSWREIHSAAWNRDDGPDVYRPGIAPLQIVVLRQRDPAEQWLPADVFEVVDRTSGLPDRVEDHPRYAIYQRVLRFLVPKDGGRYAIRIEGRQPDSTLPAEAQPLPNPERWELEPQLRTEVIDPTHRPAGRVLFQNYAVAE